MATQQMVYWGEVALGGSVYIRSYIALDCHSCTRFVHSESYEYHSTIMDNLQLQVQPTP